MRAETLDVGIGGFAVLMPSTARVGQKVEVSLELKPGIFIEGKAKVVNLQKKGKPYRVAFRFEELSAANAERLAIAVFDAALAGVMPAGQWLAAYIKPTRLPAIDIRVRARPPAFVCD